MAEYPLATKMKYNFSISWNTIFCERIGKMFRKEKDLRTINEKLLAEIDNLQRIHAELLSDQQTSEQELEELAEKVMLAMDIQVQEFCKLAGIRYTNIMDDLGNKTNEVMMHFDDCFVKLEIETDKYKLLEIYPAHTNFEMLRFELEASQDICGLLTILRDYFKGNQLTENKLEEKKAVDDEQNKLEVPNQNNDNEAKAVEDI